MCLITISKVLHVVRTAGHPGVPMTYHGLVTELLRVSMVVVSGGGGITMNPNKGRFPQHLILVLVTAPPNKHSHR